MFFFSDYVIPQNFISRYGGISVRPVTSGAAPAPTPITVPEEFTAVIDFSESWPFKQPAVGRQFQVAAGPDCDGEVYDFIYSEDAVLKVGICMGKVNTYVPVNPDNVAGTPGSLHFGRIGSAGAYEDNEGFVKTPAIRGRYLKEVKITTNVNDVHTIYICKSNKKEASGEGLLSSFVTKAYADGAASSGELDGEENTPYYIFREGSNAEKYVKIELTYSTKE